MASYLSDLNSIWDFLLLILQSCFQVFTTHPIFMSIFALWVLDRVFGIFDLIRG